MEGWDALGVCAAAAAGVASGVALAYRVLWRAGCCLLGPEPGSGWLEEAAALLEEAGVCYSLPGGLASARSGCGALLVSRLVSEAVRRLGVYLDAHAKHLGGGL